VTAERLVVIGGGPAALEAVRAYREEGADGEVVLVSDDEHLPYNRPPLSKDFLRGESEEDALPLEDGDFYRHHAIEVRLRTRAVALDPGRRVVTLSGGETLDYGWCVLATGASPKPLPVPGADGPGVRYLRSRRQARELRDAVAAARSAVVVGSGFIGCEAAASLARRGLAVTLVSMEDEPQAARLGGAASQVLRGWLEDDGVSLRLGVQVEAVERGRVRLHGESSAEGDLLLVAGGVEPAAGLAAEAGLVVEDGRVRVDEHMRSSGTGILAAGDVAFAFNSAAGRHLAVEHWGEALAMGRVAGQTAAGTEASWAEVPGFWSTIGDRTLKYAAWGDGFDDASLVGHGGGAFTVWYSRDGVTVGVLTHDADRDYERGQHLIEQRQPPPLALRPPEVHLLQPGLDGAAALPRISPGNDFWRGDIGAAPPLARRGDAEPAVAGADELLVGLAVLGQAHHQLRDPVGEVIAVVLPGVERLAVGRDQVLEVGVLRQVGYPRGDQDARPDLVVVAVPEPLLLVRQLAVPVLADDVLDSDQPGTGLIAVEDHALVQVVAQVDAEVRRLHLAAHVVGVHVKAVEIGADGLDGILPLHRTGGEVEHAVLKRVALPGPDAGHRLRAEEGGGCGHRPRDRPEAGGYSDCPGGAARAPARVTLRE
jgi:NADPH-dependent 2,4-dienoyl-CoA reductase/sulfur reductase-like enzyme